jgi:hypothetical protein
LAETGSVPIFPFSDIGYWRRGWLLVNIRAGLRLDVRVAFMSMIERMVGFIHLSPPDDLRSLKRKGADESL